MSAPKRHPFLVWSDGRDEADCLGESEQFHATPLAQRDWFMLLPQSAAAAAPVPATDAPIDYAHSTDGTFSSLQVSSEDVASHLSVEATTSVASVPQLPTSSQPPAALAKESESTPVPMELASPSPSPPPLPHVDPCLTAAASLLSAKAEEDIESVSSAFPLEAPSGAHDEADAAAAVLETLSSNGDHSLTGWPEKDEFEHLRQREYSTTPSPFNSSSLLAYSASLRAQRVECLQGMDSDLYTPISTPTSPRSPSSSFLSAH